MPTTSGQYFPQEKWRMQSFVAGRISIIFSRTA